MIIAEGKGLKLRPKLGYNETVKKEMLPGPLLVLGVSFILAISF